MAHTHPKNTQVPLPWYCGLILTEHHLPQMTFNPLSPNSDQYQNSPCDINAFYNRLVVRIKAMITQDTMS